MRREMSRLRLPKNLRLQCTVHVTVMYILLSCCIGHQPLTDPPYSTSSLGPDNGSDEMFEGSHDNTSHVSNARRGTARSCYATSCPRLQDKVCVSSNPSAAPTYLRSYLRLLKGPSCAAALRAIKHHIVETKFER